MNSVLWLALLVGVGVGLLVAAESSWLHFAAALNIFVAGWYFEPAMKGE